jgi:hypothetical protein
VSPATGELLAGTSVGELVVFNADNLIYRAALPISSNGILSLCCQGEFVFIGAGDGKVKKLQVLSLLLRLLALLAQKYQY